MSAAARLGQFAVVLVIAATAIWLLARRYADRREQLLDRVRRHQEP